MFRWLTDRYNGVPGDATVFAGSFPRDNVLFATAATVFETDTTSPFRTILEALVPASRGGGLHGSTLLRLHAPALDRPRVPHLRDRGVGVRVRAVRGSEVPLRRRAHGEVPAPTASLELEIPYADAATIETSEYRAWGVAFDFMVLDLEDEVLQVCVSQRLPATVRRALERTGGAAD